MKRTLVITLLLVFIVQGMQLRAQVTTQPTPALESKPLQIIFNATQGNAGLANYSGDIYAHIGVITNKSTSGSDWKYVKADWPNGTNSATANKPEWKLTRSSSNSNSYTLDLTPSIREYFNVAAGETIQKIAIVFRNADGSKTGKTSAGGDIFVDVFSSNIALKLNSPLDGSTYIVGDAVGINATASASKFDLYINNKLISTASTSPFSYSFTPSVANSYIIKIVATDASNSTEEASVTVKAIAPPVIAPLPAGVKPGLNIKDGKATFVLQAPKKKFCNLIGSFNDYQVSDEYVMKQTPDKEFFWITLDNLQNSTDYSYQYLIDGGIKVADPYSSLILDPWNDQYIPSETFPNLPPYPANKTSGIVSSFRMNPEQYIWKNNSFTPAGNEKLNVYEVLIRDFLAKHDYKTLTDTLKYFKNMGVNAIELMPVNEFEGNISWGYNPSFYFAVDKYYGPANDLKRFVDECHKQGIAVIIDMVLNHSFGQSPLVQMYFDKSTNLVTADNPWYNVTSPNSTYSWGYDFNHESSYTKTFVDSVNAYWMSEFKVDGYRFDFTKGFTQKPGDGWAYDASRIAILKRMTSEIKRRNPNAIVIFEHLAENTEEGELAKAGILLWGNLSNNSCEAAMGYTENNKSDLTWASYKARGWNIPGVVAYMESHDEERVSYKQENYGAGNANYNVKDLATANQRHAALATVFLSIPGPKMIWQWQELGYDHSINECENGSVDNNGGCRTNPKPAFWDKNEPTSENASRLDLKKVFAKMLEFRNNDATYSTTNYITDLTDAVKSVVLNGNGKQIISVANFDIVSRQMNVPVNNNGYYYSHFSRDSILVNNGYISKALLPGEFHLYSNARTFKPLKLTITSPSDAQVFKTGDIVNIAATTEAPKSTLYINNKIIGEYGSSINYSFSSDTAGIYNIKVVATDNDGSESKTLTFSVKNKMELNSFGPNPVKAGESVTININAGYQAPALMNIYSINGKLLYSESLKLAKGSNIIEMNTSKVRIAHQGIYIVHIKGESALFKEKIVVL